MKEYRRKIKDKNLSNTFEINKIQNTLIIKVLITFTLRNSQKQYVI